MIGSFTYFILRLLALLVVILVCATTFVTPAVGQSVWELTPYRIEVLLALDRSPELTDELRRVLADDLVRQVETHIGAAWDVDVRFARPDLRRRMLRELEAIPWETLPEESPPFDKIILLGIKRQTTGYRVTTRELDVRTQTFSATVRLHAGLSVKLRDVVFRAVLRAHAPLARVVDVEDSLVSLRLRAAAFPTRDHSFRPVVAGTLFRPMIRYNDRDGKARRVMPVPWTFLTTDSVDGASISCQLQTGLRSPLSSRRRGRTEQLALAVIPPKQPTRLTFTARGNPEHVLHGYDVYAEASNERPSRLLGRTDRRGCLLVKPSEEQLISLLVRHGGELLARLPIVPGLEPELSVALADDDLRLEAEGIVAAVQQDLVDTVALREVLLVRIRSFVEAGNIEKASELVRQLQRLKSRNDFRLLLQQEQKRVVSSDPSVQQKIDILFQVTNKALTNHLDPNPVESLAAEVAKSRTEKPDPNTDTSSGQMDQPPEQRNESDQQ